MSAANLIARGIGFSPGSIKYIVTAGLLDGVAAPVVARSIGGGGRIIGYHPEPEKKRVVKLLWTDEHEKELIALLKKIDDDFEEKRRQQFDELVNILRNAIYLGNQVAFSGFQYLREQDVAAAKRKVQQEEEAIMLLLML